MQNKKSFYEIYSYSILYTVTDRKSNLRKYFLFKQLHTYLFN